MIMPIRRLGGAFSITLLSLSLVACGGSTPSATMSAGPTAAVTPPASVAPTESADASPAETSAASPGASLATTGRIEVVDKGFALTLPAGWTRLDLSQSDIEAMMEAAGQLDPELAEQYAGQIQAMMAAGLSIFAFGPDPSAGTNLTVLSIPGAGLSLDLLDQINRSQLEALAEGEIESERITLPAGDAIHYHYSLGAQGAESATLDQYFVLAGPNQLVITATNASEADAQAIANSIEVLD